MRGGAIIKGGKSLLVAVETLFWGTKCRVRRLRMIYRVDDYNYVIGEYREIKV